MTQKRQECNLNFYSSRLGNLVNELIFFRKKSFKIGKKRAPFLMRKSVSFDSRKRWKLVSCNSVCLIKLQEKERFGRLVVIHHHVYSCVNVFYNQKQKIIAHWIKFSRLTTGQSTKDYQFKFFKYIVRLVVENSILLGKPLQTLP